MPLEMLINFAIIERWGRRTAYVFFKLKDFIAQTNISILFYERLLVFLQTMEENLRGSFEYQYDASSDFSHGRSV